jgi:hypothetical protein
MQFETLSNETTIPPVDPTGLAPIAPCEMTGSYLYSRIDFGNDNQLALIAARLEMPTSANYGTG